MNNHRSCHDVLFFKEDMLNQSQQMSCCLLDLYRDNEYRKMNEL